MYRNLIINDLKKNKLISFAILLFIATSTMLLALASMLFINLTGAIDGLMEDAKTPHFMQMHSGEIDFERLISFSESSNAVQAFQVMEFVNIEDWDIVVEGLPIDGGIQDNGVIKQSDSFDFLVNLNGDVFKPNEGEIYVPLTYMKEGSIKQGDSLAIYGRKFTVAGFLRDSQMNSPLSSSKRFLVSDSDFKYIRLKGEIEYLIEFRLKDIGSLQNFEMEYIVMGLEANGPTLTYPLFRVINGLSDGLLIAVILLVSLLVVMITFLCIRFTLIARMEDDYREIGVLKAVGLHNKDIIRLYLVKYSVMASIGCIVGYMASLVLKESMLQDIKLFMGAYHQMESEMFLGIMSAIVIFTMVMVYVYHVLRKIRNVSVTESIRFGAVQEHSKMYGKFLLSKSKVMNSNVFLAVNDVLGRKKMYVTMMMIILISIFMMTLPLGLYSTMSSEHFVSYMGIGKSDFRIDVQQATDIQGKANSIADEMKKDNDINKYVVLTARSYVVRDELGNDARLVIETGDHSIFPIMYSEGRMPTAPYDIALSAINAEEMGKNVGDKLTIVVDGNEVDMNVCAIYSDITNGGKTSKSSFGDSNETVMWSVISADVQDKHELESILSRYSGSFTYAKVTGVGEYVQKTFGSTISSLKKASIVGSLVALFLSFVITLLFVKMLISKDRYSIAIMKSIGHNHKDISSQFVVRTLIVSIVSLCLGIFMTMTLGEQIAGLMISSFGATSFSFEINGVLTYVICPALILASVFTGTVISVQNIKDIDITQAIKE